MNATGERPITKEPCLARIGDLVLGSGGPKICVPLTGRTEEEILAQAAAAGAASPDLIEWRVDCFAQYTVRSRIGDILRKLREVLPQLPLLFSYRSEGNGGYGRSEWGIYASLLTWAALQSEVSAVDVEGLWLDADTESLIEVIHAAGKPAIASAHFCGGMPSAEIRTEALASLRAAGGDIIKLAVTPRSEEDAIELLAWTYVQTQAADRPLIITGMGEYGKFTRVAGALTGSALTFASVLDAPSAPGQLSVEETRHILAQLRPAQEKENG